jgi:hypothetical protein
MLSRSLALLTILGTTLPAQEKADLLARLPADTTSLLVLGDVMPHVDAVLASPQWREVLVASADIQTEVFGMAFDADALRRQVGLVRNLIPTEVVVAAPEATAATLLHALDASLQFALLVYAERTGGMAVDAETVRAQAGAALAAIGGLEAVAWLRLRDERTAEGWFDNVAEAVESARREGLAVDVGDAVLTVRLQPLQLQLPGGTVRAELRSRGVPVAEGAGPAFVLRLAQRGAELELRLGAPAEGPLPSERLGPLWQPDAAQLLFARVDLGDTHDQLVEFIERALELAEAIDDPDLSMRLSGLAARAWELAAPMTGSVRVDDGIVSTKEVEVGPEAAGELEAPDAAVVRCIARGHGPFVLSALPLDVLLSLSLDEILLRLASRGRELPVELEAVGDFLAGEQSMLFEPGTLLMARPAQFRGSVDPELGPMPFAAAAIVAKAEDDQSAGEFMQRVTAHLQEGYGVTGELWQARDLGLGVPTQVLDLAMLAGVDADLMPHWCVVDGVLVVSSDPKLTTDVLARLRGTDSERLPAGRLIDWSDWPGEHWESACVGLAAWWRAMPQAWWPGERPSGPFAAMLDSLAVLCRTFESIQTMTELDGRTVREVTRLRLRSPR